jgi:hypothetical protein
MELPSVFVMTGAEVGVEAKLSRGEKNKSHKENTITSSSEVAAT